jgi:regulator of sigma E protease
LGQRAIKGRLRKGKIVLTTNILYSAVYFIIVLGILVFIHELGHFLLAKKLGVGVLKFSLGFGPKLWGKKIRETEYQIAVFPLGGFVKLIGENPEEKVEERDSKYSFLAQPIWKRVLIICAGPFFNIFLTVVVLCSSFIIYGIPYDTLPLPPKVGDISPGLPAEKAGLQRGDTILSINGISTATWEDLSNIIRNSEGKELDIKVKRKESILEFKISPKISKEKTGQGEKTIYIIGITAPYEETKFLYKKVSPVEAIYEGSLRTWYLTELTVVVLGKMISGEISPKTIGGPIQIAQEAGRQGRKGLPYLLSLIAILGINLGIINLFPIPILDGGHILFLIIEAILGKPVSMKKMEIAQQVGLILLIFLMIYAFHNDIRRLLPGGYRF